MGADLAARLEAATEGSRELSDEVLVACGWTVDPGLFWRKPDGWHCHDDAPDPTRSVDDSIALIGERRWYIAASARDDMGGYFVQVGKPTAHAATPALALCAAIVKGVEPAP